MTINNNILNWHVIIIAMGSILLIGVPLVQTAYSQDVAETQTPTNSSAESVANGESVANLDVVTYKNSKDPVVLDLKSLNGGANLVYLIDESPRNGKIEGELPSKIIPNGIVRYLPNTNFDGYDSFTYVTKTSPGTNSQSLPGQIGITVKPPSSALDMDKNLRIALSFFLAIVIVIIVTLSARHLIKKATVRETLGYKSRFTDILRGYDMDPSLSIFQFFLWTLVLMFAFISVYFVRIFGGVSDPPVGPIPIYLLAIAGISVATPIVSSLISSAKYAHSSPVQFISDIDNKATLGSNETIVSNQTNRSQKPSFSNMLKEFGKPTLSRFQMFAWTWIGIAIYLAVFVSTVVEHSNNVYDLSIPDVDPVLVVLMGLSQFAFLGIKTATSNEIQISMIYPSKIPIAGKFSIFGKDFGEEIQSVYIGSHKVSFEDNLIEVWTSDRIDVRLPGDLGMGTYNVVVIKGGSAMKSKDKLEIILPVTQGPNTDEHISNGTIGVNNESITIQKDTEFNTSFRRINPNLDNTDVKFLIVDQPTNGKVTLNADGHSIVYTPNLGYVGADTFTYKAKKGDIESKNGTIRITIA